MRHAREDYDRIQDPSSIIPEDEPVFLLRGQDYLAHIVVRVYATLATLLGCDPELVERWRAQAERMKNCNYHKAPDL